MEFPVKTVVLLSILSLHILPVDGQLWVAAFNIQKFSQNKLGIAWVKDVIIRILCQYDIVFIQEIQPNMNRQLGRNGIEINPMVDFVNDINKYCGGSPFEKFLLAMTPFPLPVKYIYDDNGEASNIDFRGTELYAYIYRRVTLVKANVHQQGPQQQPIDIFRPPYSATFRTHNPGLHCMPTFTLIGLHAKPDRVLQELNELVKVYNELRDATPSFNALILGDLNADGNYFPQDNEPQCIVCVAPFTWLIPRWIKTNTRGKMSYDRFIAVGPLMSQCASNAGPAINTVNQAITSVRQDYAVQNWNLMQYHAVSDHYPIELKLECPPNPQYPWG